MQLDDRAVSIRQTHATLHTDVDDEAIQLRPVTSKWRIEVEEVRLEVAARYQLDGSIYLRRVSRAVVVLEVIVDGVLRQLGVKLTLVACSIRTIVVVDTVGDIGGLLDLSDEAACTDGVDTACREEEDIPRMDFVLG